MNSTTWGIISLMYSGFTLVFLAFAWSFISDVRESYKSCNKIYTYGICAVAASLILAAGCSVLAFHGGWQGLA